jgi:hypothetical protein
MFGIVWKNTVEHTPFEGVEVGVDV